MAHETPRHILRMLVQDYPQHMGLADAMDRTPEVRRLLTAAKIRWVSIGASALAEYLEPRATVDLDLLVAPEKMHRALSVIQRHFAPLEIDDAYPDLIRIRGAVPVDLVGATTALYVAVLKKHRKKGSLRLATVEQLAALKYQAILSPNRDLQRKYQDKSDFVGLAYRVQKFDILERLGELIAPGEGERFIQTIGTIRLGLPVEL